MAETITIELETLLQAYCLLSDVGEALDDRAFLELARKLGDAIDRHHRDADVRP